MLKLKIKKLFINHWQFIFAFILIIWAFGRWFLPGIITWGDWWPETEDSYLDWLKPNLWSGSKSFGMNMLKEFSAPVWLPSFTLAAYLIKFFGLNYNSIERIIWFWPYVVIAPFSFYFFWRTFFPKRKNGILFGSLFFVVNTYSMLLTMGGHINLAIVYALTPTILALVKKYTDNPSRRIGLILGLTVTFALLYEVRGIMLVTGLVLFYLLAFARQIGLKKISRVLFYYFLPPLLLNLWWIIPFVFQKQTEILPPTFDEAKWVISSSYADLAHAITLFHQQWYDNILGKINPVPAIFFIIPLVLIPSLLWFRRYPSIKFFTALAIVSIFFVKGANEPFGQIYLAFFKYFPGFKAFRDPSKFNLYLALSYTVLWAFLIDEAAQLIKQANWRRRWIALVSLLPIFWLLPVYSQKIGGTFNLIKKPTVAYQQFAEKLKADQNFSRIVWLPKQQRFGYFSETHPRISLDSEIRNSLSFLKYETNETQDALLHPLAQFLLSDAAVRYLVIPNDDTNDIYKDYHAKEFYLNLAQKTPWLNKRSDFKLNVYEIANPEKEIYLRNHWLYTNTFNVDLLYSYLTKQKVKPALILTEPDRAPEIASSGKNQPFLFAAGIAKIQDRIQKKTDFVTAGDQSDIEIINLKVGREQPFSLFIPKSLTDRVITELYFDHGANLIPKLKESPWNENYSQIDVAALKPGTHQLSIKISSAKNLFAGGEINKTDFESQAEFCAAAPIYASVSNTEIVPGGFDGGDFLKIHSYAQASCFARQISQIGDQRQFRLSFDFQSKFGNLPIIKVIESDGNQRIFQLADYYSEPDKVHNRWHHWSEDFILNPESDSFLIVFEMPVAEDFNKLGPSESWFDNIKLQAGGALGGQTIFYGQLNDLTPTTEPDLKIQKINNGQFRATVTGAAAPNLIVLNNQYNPDWIATTNQAKVSQNIKTNGLANGFIVAAAQDYTIEFNFGLMKWARLGFYLSLVFLVLIILLVIRFPLRSQGNRRE